MPETPLPVMTPGRWIILALIFVNATAAAVQLGLGQETPLYVRVALIGLGAGCGAVLGRLDSWERFGHTHPGLSPTVHPVDGSDEEPSTSA